MMMRPFTIMALAGLGSVMLLATPACGQDKYIITSIPVLKQIHYAKLPDTVMRPLIISGLIAPKNIAVDAANNRLFVTDNAQLAIFWWQLIATPDGKLITDGVKHTAVGGVVAKGLACDPSGNLYFSGTMVPPPGFTSPEAIYRHGTIALATGATTMPELLWDPGNTADPGNPGMPPRVKTPNGIATNGFNIFWGNSADAMTHATLARAPATPQTVAPNMQVVKMADNANSVRGIVITPKFVFYATGDNGQIFGVPLNRQGPCGNECHTIISGGKLSDPIGMVWDGDGTVYVSDAGKGKVFSFPAGNLGEHEMSEVVSAPLYDVDLLVIDVPQAASTGFLGLW